MALITVSQGKREGAFGGPDGAYQATLVAIEGPRPATNSRTGEEFSLLDWVFAIEGAPDDACLVWASTSVASGPKSKMYGYLTALLGGTVAGGRPGVRGIRPRRPPGARDHPARRGRLAQGRERQRAADGLADAASAAVPVQPVATPVRRRRQRTSTPGSLRARLAQAQAQQSGDVPF